MSESYELAVFATSLGWMGLAWCERRVERLVFGYGSRWEALRAIGDESISARGATSSPSCSTVREVVDRLRAYGEGQPVDLAVVPVALRGTSFQCRVWQACRRIGYGRTATYRGLAAMVNEPRAARAVGRAMATNPLPLLVPCHRVLSSGGGLGGYSAPGGVAVKRRLLEMEGADRWIQAGSGGELVGVLPEGRTCAAAASSVEWPGRGRLQVFAGEGR